MKLRCSRPKGEQIIAQGFSPGRGSKSSPPCKGDRFTIGLQDETTRLLTTYVGRPLHPKRTPRSPLSGRLNYLPNPGLKPWAMFCSRFAAKRDRLLGCSLIPFRIFTP
jgi:hypothetical protein